MLRTTQLLTPAFSGKPIHGPQHDSLSRLPVAYEAKPGPSTARSPANKDPYGGKTRKSADPQAKLVALIIPFQAFGQVIFRVVLHSLQVAQFLHVCQ